MRIHGFTLAEILITLTIIGVVAALTVPIIINNYKKLVTVNRLKSSYTIFAQAIQQSENDNGSYKTWDISRPSIIAEKYINPYLKGISKASAYNVKALHFDTSHLYWSTQVPIYNMSNGITYQINKGIGTTANYISVLIDINGKRRPNRMGKDVFIYMIRDRGLSGLCGITRTSNLDNYYSACSKVNKGTNSYSGGCCGGLIMLDGWKINDDYPW